MVQHYLRLENHLETNKENHSFEDILRNIGEEDQLVISMDQEEIKNSDHIFDLLRSNGFEVLPKGGHDDEKYHIIAQRKKKS